MKVSGFGFQVSGVVFCLLSFVLGCATTPAHTVEKNNAKNVYDVSFERLPETCEDLLTEDLGGWNFNFRPYGRTSDLWTDPSAVRDVGDGKALQSKPTAMRVACNEDGWSFLVFCGEPSLKDELMKTNSLPYPFLELYVGEGDTDNYEPAPYWQFLYERGKVREIKWSVEGATWRPLMDSLRYATRVRDNGFVVRFDFQWEAFWDRLPIFTERADNFWRLGIMRWAAGGVTWGGDVHEPNRYGYIRWPAFTPAQKTEIMSRVLECGWHLYRELTAGVNYNVTQNEPGGWQRAAYVRSEPYAIDAVKADGPRSYTTYAEDPEFRPTLERLEAACAACAPKIAAFRALPSAEQETVYREVSAKLFNFRYDVEKAYEAHVHAKLMGRGK